MNFPSASDSASRSESATPESFDRFKSRIAQLIGTIADQGGRSLHQTVILKQLAPGVLEQMAEFLKDQGYQAWVEAFGSPENAKLVVKW